MALTEQQTTTEQPTPEQLEKLRGCKGLSAAVDEGAMTLEAALAEIAKREGKPRSGYQRKKIAMMRLIAEHDALKKAYQDLAGYSDTLTAECKRRDEEVASLQSMYAALQSDVQLVLAENQRCSMPLPSCAAAPFRHSRLSAAAHISAAASGDASRPAESCSHEVLDERRHRHWPDRRWRSCPGSK